MKFLGNLFTAISIPVVSFLPTSFLSNKCTDLHWVDKFSYPAIKFDTTSNEYMQARPKSDYRVYQWEQKGGSNYDIAMGGITNGKRVHEHNHAITSTPFKLSIKGTIPADKVNKLAQGQEVLVSELTDFSITNRDDILRHFLHTAPNENEIKNEYDWYVNPQNHMGTERGDWNFHNNECGNPTNLYDFDARGQWLDTGEAWRDKCQGLQQSDKGSNGEFKCWLFEYGDRPVFGYWPSCNAPISLTRDYLAKDWWYKRNGNWKKNSGVEQSEQVFNFVTDELLNDNKNLNVNKWTSWDDSWWRTLTGFYFCLKPFFDCVKISMETKITPPKKMDYKLKFRYDSSLLNGKAPFSFYWFLLAPGHPLDASQQLIHCFHPTADYFGGICTEDNGDQMNQRGQMCGIFQQSTYNNTVVNPSVYTWDFSGSWDIVNPLVE